jgi:hypothetical protein
VVSASEDDDYESHPGPLYHIGVGMLWMLVILFLLAAWLGLVDFSHYIVKLIRGR